MKSLKLLIITSALCLFALVAFCVFRTVPVSRLWKGYQVLYVTAPALTEQEIVAVLDENGCKNVVSRSVQRVPIVSKFAPVQVQEHSSYLTSRNDFFTDESKKSLVFYIPEGQDAALSRALRDLHDRPNVVAGTDSVASFPWISPIISLAFAAVCAFFARNRLAYLPAAFFLVVFSFSRPLFTTSAVVCLALYGFFMLQKIWGRRDFSHRAASPLIVLCLLVPLLLLFLSSPVSALFYALSLVASFAALMLCDVIKTLYVARYANYRFLPIKIRGARLIPLVERREVKLLLILLAAVVVMLVVSFSGNALSTIALDASQPALPAPLSARSQLPDLDDFVEWSWSTITFPYRRLGETPSAPMENDTVTISDYALVNGAIQETERTAYVFNTAFRNTVYDSIKSLPYPALEKLLLRQGKDARYGYAKSGGKTSERWGTVLLILFALIPAGITGYFVLIRRHYGISL